MKSIVTTLSNIICNKYTLCIVATFWVIFQILYAEIYHDTGLLSDPGAYVYYAEECVKNGTTYPDLSNYYDSYIFNPGIINIFILWIKLFGNINGIWYMFIVMNIAIMLMIGKTCNIIMPGEKAVAYVAMYMFMLIPANALIVSHTFSEVPFEFFCMFSFMYALRRNYVSLILAGICIAIAYWIRPLGAAWILATAIYMVLKFRSWRQPAAYLVSGALTLCFIAISSHRHFPDYNYTATTGGYNIIMGANDSAVGAYDNSVFKPGRNGYLGETVDSTRPTRIVKWANTGELKYYNKTTYTYAQYDSIYMSRSKEWIKNNPGKWLSQIPYKFKFLFVFPGSAFIYRYPALTYENDGLKYRIFCWIDAINGIFTRYIFFPLIMLYWIVFVAFISWRKYSYLYVALPVIFATGITMAAVVAPRYNFIMIPWIYIGICIAVAHITSIWKGYMVQRKIIKP